MDLDDLFGAFDGAEKAKDVQAAKDQVNVAVGKRKGVGEGEKAGAGASKRQALLGKSEVATNGGAQMSTERTEGPVALVEGEESSTVREDGTLVKSVRTYEYYIFIGDLVCLRWDSFLYTRSVCESCLSGVAHVTPTHIVNQDGKIIPKTHS